jgi:hypothetical protein
MRALMVFALAVTSSVSFAQTSAPADTTAVSNAPTKMKPLKPICRSEDTTGSMFPTRTCHTKEEWTAIDAANAANAERMRNSRSSAGRN